MTIAGTLHALHVVLNVADFFAWFCAFGLIMARTGLLPRTAFDLHGLEQRWRWSLLGCLTTLAMTGAGLLVVRSLEMSGLLLEDVISILPQVLWQTHFGRVWIVHLALLPLLAAAMLPPPGLSKAALVCIALALAVTYSAASHAADQGDLTFSELNDWAHVVSASLWAGGILATLLFAFPALKGRRELLAATLLRLSRVSAVALAGVTLTGVNNAWLRLHDFEELLATDYGRDLATKVALAGLMAMVGAYGRFFTIPGLRRASDELAAAIHLRRMRIALAFDAVLVTLVLIAVGQLIQGMPPSAMHGMRGMTAAMIR
jgi:putative copper resistance protein D